MSDEFSFWEFHGRFPILIVVAGLNLPSGAEPSLHYELLVPLRLSPWFDIFNQNLHVPSTYGPHTLYRAGPLYLC